MTKEEINEFMEEYGERPFKLTEFSLEAACPRCCKNYTSSQIDGGKCYCLEPKAGPAPRFVIGNIAAVAA